MGDECRICRNRDGNTQHIAREMMFGTKEEFAYFQCAECECLQIAEIPADMSSHYPDNYYSMTAPLPGPTGDVRDAVRRTTAQIRLRGVNPGGTKRGEIFTWLRGAGVGMESAILDVGCGRGRLLHNLRLDGFRRLTGVGPFVAEDLAYDNGIRIHKRELADLPGEFDLVMMHHSFEHMPDQHGALRAASERLRAGGCLLIRIPLVSSYVWRHYGVDWFQLDAPRHFYLHSAKSLERVANDVGLRIADVVYDSKASQFWGSEQYRAGVAHRAPESHGENPDRSMFSPTQILKWRVHSRWLNRKHDGDAACFFLRQR